MTDLEKGLAKMTGEKLKKEINRLGEKMSEEKYLKELDSAFHKWYEIEDDREVLHVACDNLLVKFLKENNYIKLAEKYEKMSEYFWYA